jgi:SAM-dependent methyltransferase
VSSIYVTPIEILFQRLWDGRNLVVNLTNAAQNYADYRPRYPRQLIDDLRKRSIGERGERLVDWGCGTGELTLPLSPFFARVTAVDISPAMVSVGRASARRAGIENIEWCVDRAENLEMAPESCDLITSASAFHWMDRELLARRAYRALRSGAMLALVGGAGGNLWRGTVEWQQVAVECLEKHIGGRTPGGRRAGQASKRHDDFLVTAGFEIERLDYPADCSWQIDEVAGYLYSITGWIPGVLGDKRKAFEREFSDALARANPSGVIHQTIDFYLLMASKP